MEGLIFFLKQFVIFLGSVQVCFIYYFTLKTRWFGKNKNLVYRRFDYIFRLPFVKEDFRHRFVSVHADDRYTEYRSSAAAL